MSQAIDLTIGLMRPDELPFVAKSWKLSLRDAPQNDGVQSGAYFNRINRDFDAILARPGTRVLVARHAVKEGRILGFICVEHVGKSIALHWTYTRQAVRRMGVCSSLLEHALAGAKDEELVFTSGSRFDDMWSNWGFEQVSLSTWLRGASK